MTKYQVDMFLLRNDRGTVMIVNTPEVSCTRFEFGIVLGAGKLLWSRFAYELRGSNSK